MIRKFEHVHFLEPESTDHIQWAQAIAAGLIAGLILLVLPGGSPWSSTTFFSPLVLGRSVAGISTLEVWMLHLLVSIVYGLLICWAVMGLRQARAILTGGLFGLILYVVNFGVVSTWWPQIRGNEGSVLFTHVVFGLVIAGAYRGLLRRKAAG